MENVKMYLESSQTKQDNFEIQEYNEDENKRQQEEIKEMKQEDSKSREQQIESLMNRLNEDPEIDQWIIDLFNQLKKEKNREEYLQKFVEDYLKSIWATYDSKMVKDLVSKYCRKSIKESLDFHDSVEFFNSDIQSLKWDIEKLVQTNVKEKISLDKSHSIWKIVLSTAFWKNFNLLWMSWTTWVYSVPWESVVFKLDTLKLAEALEAWNNYCDSSKSDKRENDLFQKMESYFPDGSVLTPENHKKTIDIDDALLKELGVSNINIPNNFTFIYTTTPIAFEINNGWVGFNMGFGRWLMDRLMWNNFAKKFNWEWVTQKELNEFFDKEFDEVIDNIKKLSNDDDKIKELLRWLIKYSEDNDIVLDIYWTDNFTFYLDTDWNLKYHIIDPFMPWIISKSRLKSYNVDKNRNVTIDNIHARSYEYIIQKMKDYCK